MKPVDFDYAAPATIAEVLELLRTWGARAKILAGGQSLVPLLVARTVRPEFVIDITRVAGLDVLEARGDGLVFGATVRQSDAENSELVRARCPLLAEALNWVAVPQVRNLGTVVGSLAQRNAISEVPTVAIATGAQITVATAGGASRVVEAETFLDPADAGTLQPDELVTEAWFPAQAAGTAWGFAEVQRRQAHYALVGAAVTFQFDENGRIAAPRVAASGISTRPVRLRSVEAALLGQNPGAEIFAQAAQLAVDDPSMNAFGDVHATAAYRREVAPAIISRALHQAEARRRAVR